MGTYTQRPNLVFDHTTGSHAVGLVRVEPSDSNGVAKICILPAGRVIDAGTGAPFAAIGNGSAQGGTVFSGRVLFEFADVGCQGTTCAAGALNTDVELSANATVDVMPAGFTIAELF